MLDCSGKTCTSRTYSKHVKHAPWPKRHPADVSIHRFSQRGRKGEGGWKGKEGGERGRKGTIGGGGGRGKGATRLPTRGLEGGLGRNLNWKDTCTLAQRQFSVSAVVCQMRVGETRNTKHGTLCAALQRTSESWPLDAQTAIARPCRVCWPSLRRLEATCVLCANARWRDFADRLRRQTLKYSKTEWKVRAVQGFSVMHLSASSLDKRPHL